MSNMTIEADLIRLLAAAASADTPTVDAVPFAALDRAAAYRVQTAVLAATGAGVGMLKTAIHAETVGVVAPIPAAGVGYAPDFELPSNNVLGLEVEVGLVLKRDVASAADLPDAIDHYFTGVEICGTRYADRTLAGPNGGLADSMSALGYVIGARRGLGDQIGDMGITLDFAGKRIYAAPAKHGFGTVLASLIAYAGNQHPAYPLGAGTIITTGSMCGLVPVSGPGHVIAMLGDERVEFDIV
jgi:2-keto-4-pentenoate hydratase